MCMTLSEQKQLLKKTKLSQKGASPFDVHEAIVANSDDENRISRRAQRLLQRKFGKEAKALLTLDHDGFLSHFEAADAEGDHAAALWATAIHPNLPLYIKREIFGQVHMSMHFSGEERMKLNRKLAARESELVGLRQSNRVIAQQKRALEKELQDLNQCHARLKVTLDAFQKDLVLFQKSPPSKGTSAKDGDLEQEVRFLKSELEGLYACNNRQQHQIGVLTEKNKELALKLKCQGELNHRIRNETQTLLADLATKSRCDQNCPSFDLCKKRILIVGGMSRMASLYRDLIEASGGIFEYHDGYMKKGNQQLESRLRRADIVLCPVNCNSHNACTAVKRLAKKHQKPVHMLANSSLQAISQAIWGKVNQRHLEN